MDEAFPSEKGYEEPHELDRELIVGRLQEYGVPIELEDLDGFDEDEAYDLILTYALQSGVDMDEVLPQVAPVESRDRSKDTPR
jgi:hypothetical protein